MFSQRFLLVLLSVVFAAFVGVLAVVSPMTAVAILLAASGLVYAVQASPLIPLGAFVIVVIGIPYDMLLQYRVMVGSIPFNVADAVAVLAFVSLLRHTRLISLPAKVKGALIVLGSVVVLDALMGFIKHNDPVLVVREFRYFAYLLLVALSLNILGRMGHAIGVLKWAAVTVVMMQFSQLGLYLGGYTPSLRNIRILAQFLPVLYVMGLGAAADSQELGRSWKKWLGLLVAVAVVLSLTRTVWLQFILSIVLVSAAIFRGSPKIVLRMVTILVVTLVAGAALAPQTVWAQFQTRWTDLSNPLSNTDTLSFRITDSLSLVRKLDPRAMLLGEGLGAQVEISVVGISGQPMLVSTDYTENSVLFYLWKTGLPGTIAMAWLLAAVLRELLRDSTDAQATRRATFWGILAFIGIGAWSGNLTPTQHAIFILAVPFGLITASASHGLVRNGRVTRTANVTL